MLLITKNPFKTLQLMFIYLRFIIQSDQLMMISFSICSIMFRASLNVQIKPSLMRVCLLWCDTEYDYKL